MAVVLLTGGRAPAALALARLFHHAGHTVHAAESLPFPLTSFSRCVRGRHRLSPPVSHPRRFAGELRQLRQATGAERLVAVNEELFWVSGLGLAPWCEVEPLDRLRQLHSKFAFIELCRELGFAVPRTLRVHGSDGQDPRQLVFKPEFSRFASRVVIRPQLWPAGPWVAQEFLEGRLLCTWGYARQGRLLAHGAYAAEERLGRGSALRFADDADERILAWAERFVAATGFTGPIAFDLIDTGYSINSWARDYLPQPVSAPVAVVPPVSPEPPKPPKRSGADIVADVAMKIVAHLAATGASFWTGGVPEARAQIGIPEDVNGKTVSSAFTRIEENKVGGFSATRASVSHRKRGTYALWTVTVAQTKRGAR